jgi:hypothetical protein
MMRCDVCFKEHDSLGQYTPEPWFVCLDCFAKADAIAATADRWPTAEDFRTLKMARLGATAYH